MFDPFEELDLPRRPWIDAGQLQERIDQLSLQRHPDRAGGSTAAYSQLNESVQLISGTPRRLDTIAKLEGWLGSDPMEEVPADTATLVFDAAQLCNSAKGILETAPQSTLAILLRKKSLTTTLEQLVISRESLNQHLEGIDAAARQLDVEWDLLSPHERRSRLLDLRTKSIFLDRARSNIGELITRAQLDMA
jgi:hypothetical protein